MSLPYFLGAGDLIVNPRCVARVRRIRSADGSPFSVRIRFVRDDGPEEQLEGEDAATLFEAFRMLATPSAPGAPPPGPRLGAGPDGLDAIDSDGDTPPIVRDRAGDESSRAE